MTDECKHLNVLISKQYDNMWHLPVENGIAKREDVFSGKQESTGFGKAYCEDCNTEFSFTSSEDTPSWIREYINQDTRSNP